MIALDLFAVHGWGVACQKLGIEEYGVEIMPEAQAIRAANGMTTAYSDVWQGLIDDLVESREGYGREAAERMIADGVTLREVYEILIASPPCHAMTGKPGHWVRPAPTVTGGGAATGGAEPFGRAARAAMPEGASRITTAEAAALQSYPPDFVWSAEITDPKTGRKKPITKTNTFLQIGNAVPPKLAEAILAGFLYE